MLSTNLEPPNLLVEENGFATRAKLWIQRFATHRRGVFIARVVGIPLLTLFATSLFFYWRYSNLIDTRLQGGPFRDSVNIYAAPVSLAVGDEMRASELISELRAAGYETLSDPGARPSGAGLFQAKPGGVELAPAGSDAKGMIYISSDRISRMVFNGKDVAERSLGAPLITTLSLSGDEHKKNEERLLVRFDAIPPMLVNAVVATEDKRFFQHGGLDLRRILKAAYVDARDRRKEQGASTLTMQLVRGLWLEPDKLWLRKFAEAMMTLHLEHEWSKEKIFETYANQVYLGRQAAYSVHGFGQGSRLFFGKELRDITLPEAALLAGMVQRPSYFNPFRNPEHARERRDLVLAMMRDNRYIDAGQYQAAVHAPIQLATSTLSAARAPYFLDLVNDELQNHQTNGDSVRSVYSTIDMKLQHAADEAVSAGMTDVDKLLAKRNGPAGTKAEAVLIALDPRTGEIKAVVGGRDYAKSQLNRALSRRPPGSVFKPFVYAAALNTAISGGHTVFTPASMVDDTPVTFWFGGKAYQPGNFHGEVFGNLSLRNALAKSDNVAAVHVAQGVGYDAVVQMAQRAGLNSDIKATPSVALGSYDVTPLEMAGAYTVFANGGRWERPRAVSSYRDVDGGSPSAAASESKQALDPRVAWLMVSMLEEVMRSGTAAGVRARGFYLPAAGKTGTSHDGWFAGFTSQLLCIVWVGFDDYKELNLEGAKSALPIWTDFMKRASRMGAYKNAKEFPTPAGIEQASICVDSGKVAGDQCTNTRVEYFIAGSEPEKCDQHGGGALPQPVLIDAADAPTL